MVRKQPQHWRCRLFPLMRSFSNLNCWSKTNTMPSPDKYIKVRSGSFPCKYANEATTSYLHAIKTDLRNRVPLRKPCFQGICKTKCYPCNRNFRFGLFLQKLNSVFKVRFLELLLQKSAHKKLLLQTGSKNPYSAGSPIHWDIEQNVT